MASATLVATLGGLVEGGPDPGGELFGAGGAGPGGFFLAGDSQDNVAVEGLLAELGVFVSGWCS